MGCPGELQTILYFKKLRHWLKGELDREMGREAQEDLVSLHLSRCTPENQSNQVLYKGLHRQVSFGSAQHRLHLLKVSQARQRL